MPEGDTIARTARALSRALAGRTIRRARSAVPHVPPERLRDRTIVSITPRGKHLLVALDDGATLRTHLRMNGAWHVYPPGARWFRPVSSARLVLEVDQAVAVCFDAPTVELWEKGRIPPDVEALGPDLLATDFDENEAVRRLRALGDLPIGEALLRQDAVAGAGNIYKSETLFLAGADPFAPVSAYGDDELRTVVKKARRLLRENVAHFARSFRGPSRGEQHWVYRRSGRPCRRCGTIVEMRRQGALSRSTYFCPRCQPPRHIDAR